MKCNQCAGTGRSNRTGRWLKCDECFGHGFVFDHVPTDAELKELGVVDRDGDLDQVQANTIRDKWTQFLKDNPAPDMTPNPAAALSYESLIADGVPPDAAKRTCERAGLPYPKELEPGTEPARASRTIRPDSGPTPGGGGSTGE